ncbi:MAG: dienelactone hydrolase family protein [Subtercola sp.]|nr:dienelactone hydrolase family protein [Subtercola sp.]
MSESGSPSSSPFIRLGSHKQPFDAYLAAPERPLDEFKGGVVVIHEVWGLTPQITGIADRFAAAGYLALAPDLMGDAALDPEVATELQRGLSDADPEVQRSAQTRLGELMAPVAAPEFATRALTILIAAVEYLQNQNGIDGCIAVTGYSFGGSYAFSLALADTRVRASVPYYGYANYTTDLLREISCPILYFVGQDDAPLMDALPTLNARMRESGTGFTAVVYPGAGHAFFNETNDVAYRAAAAEDSWQRTLAFFEEALSGLN